MIAFWILAALIVASALFVVTARKPIYSVVWLLANFALLAIMYLTLSAEFLAVVQILVYSGAILMLFLFVIALLSSGVRAFNVGPDRLPRVLVPLSVVGMLALGGLLFVLSAYPQTLAMNVPTTSIAGDPGLADVFGSVSDFGKALFTTYLLPFEATAIVLMIAVIGVIALAGDADPPRPVPRRREDAARTREPILKDGS